MERITDIKELKAGQQIWHINRMTGIVEIMEFICIHPHNEKYSVFLNQNYDGMPKFWNENLKQEGYFLYDGSRSCWEHIYKAQIHWHNAEIQSIKQIQDMKQRMKAATEAPITRK